MTKDKPLSKNQQALNDAAKTGYFVKIGGVTSKTKYQWRKICIEKGIPFACIQSVGQRKYKALEFDTDPLFDYSCHHGLAHPSQEMAPTKELKDRLDKIMHRYRYNGGWTTAHIYMRSITFEQAKEIMEELIAIWEIAKQHPMNAWKTLDEEYQEMKDRGFFKE